MLEKIGKEYYEKLSVPNQLFLEYIRKLKADTAAAITIAEIGVGIGATAQAVLQTLDINDQYYLDRRCNYRKGSNDVSDSQKRARVC